MAESATRLSKVPAIKVMLTGRSKSRNHQTISEHVFGSGAMTNTGSASTRHSQIDHKDGKKEANARSGVEGGKEARIWKYQVKSAERD